MAAELIITCFGAEVIAHFGASSSELRVKGATASLQYEAMRLARTRGCTRYDMGAVWDVDPPPVEVDRPGSRGGDWQGIHHFKASFGGKLVARPPALERHYLLPPQWAFWRR